jgi:hypothetical protein
LDEDTLQLNEQISEASAANSFRIAKFYDKQGKHKSAMIYYNEVLKLPGGPDFEAARDRVNELTSKDPTLVEQKNIKISPKQLAIKAQADTKSRPDYLGPPAPVDLSKRMRRDSNPAAIDIAPIEEAALPMETPTGAPDASLLAPAAPAPDVPTESRKMDKEKGTAIAEPALPSLEKPAAEGEAPAPAAPEGEKKEEVKPADPK